MPTAKDDWKFVTTNFTLLINIGMINHRLDNENWSFEGESI